MKQPQLEVIASAVNKRVSDGLTELLYKDAGYQELCSTVAQDSQILFDSCSPEQRKILDSYMEHVLSVKSVENHFTYMLGISDLDCFKEAVGSKAWVSVMLNCTDQFIGGGSAPPVELYIVDDNHAQNEHHSQWRLKRVPIMIPVLGMAICLLTGAVYAGIRWYKR